MENVRRNVLIFCYQLRHNQDRQHRVKDYLGSVKYGLNRYTSISEQIMEKSKERKAMLDVKKDTPIWNIPKRPGLVPATQRIA